MKFSKYNITFDVDKRHYLHNVLSTSIAEIDDNIVSSIKANTPASLSTEHIDLLSKQHFIVEDSLDETQEYMYFYNLSKYGNNSKSLNIIYIPTYSCNLSCTYCMQGQKKDKKIIDQQSQSKTLLFIKKKVEESKKRTIIDNIGITIFGGEPLVAKPEIINFCDEINEIAKTNNCKLYLSLVSNGTLIDEDIINLIKKHNIMIQISIDGTKDHHDTTRIRKDGRGTYDKIIDNLKTLCDNGLKDNIVIRLNTDLNNLSDAEEVMKSVRQYSNDIFYGFIDSFKGLNDEFSTCLNHNKHSEALTNVIYPIYEKYGFHVNRAFGKASPCSMCSENSYIIDCNCDVYKCEMLVNQKDTKIGEIDEDGNLVCNSNFFKQMSISPDKNPRCYNCKLLPLCGGGCFGKSYIDKGSKDSDFDCYDCIMEESDLINYLKDYIRRLDLHK